MPLVDVPGLRFVRLPEIRTNEYRRPRSFAFIEGTAQVALSDSELLLTSHSLPIAVDASSEEPQVVALTLPLFQRSPLVGSDGRWLRPYIPIALRCLPFRLAHGSAAQPSLEIATNLAGSDTDERLPLLDAAGKPTKQIGSTLALLARLEKGVAKLRDSAEQLLVADVLSPLRSTDPHKPLPPGRKFLTIDPEKFAALPPYRVAPLARDGFLPLDLVAACLLSSRLLPPFISVATEEGGGDISTRAIAPNLDALVRGSFQIDVQVDESDLFSFEAFDQATWSVDGKDELG